MEVWKAVQGYEGEYQVSSLGRVRSLDRVVVQSNGRCIPVAGRLLAQGRRGDYPGVVLIRPGHRWHVSVHTLVATAFLGTRPPGMVVRHRNGNADDCSADNLQWGTHGQNQRDRVEHGTHSRGEKSSSAKLSEQQVLAIRARRSGGESLRVLAAEFRVSKSLISRISAGKHRRYEGGELTPLGTVRSNSVLNDEQVRELRTRRAGGEKLKDLARVYGVDHTVIASLALGKSRLAAGGPISKSRKAKE